MRHSVFIPLWGLSEMRSSVWCQHKMLFASSKAKKRETGSLALHDEEAPDNRNDLFPLFCDSARQNQYFTLVSTQIAFFQKVQNLSQLEHLFRAALKAEVMQNSWEEY